MHKRLLVILGMLGGILWGVAVLWWGGFYLATTYGTAPNTEWAVMLPGFLPAGLITILMIGRLTQRRFFDDAIIDGDTFETGSSAEIDQRVLTNTVEQLVLALCIWPMAGVLIGPGVVIALGVSFAIARILFWIGYHLSPPLRGLGFAATFYPTILAALWVGWTLWQLAS